MTTLSLLPIAILVVAGSLPLAQHLRAPEPGVTQDVSLPLAIVADDATYKVFLPVGWQQVGQVTLDYGIFFDNQTESFVVGMDQVYIDPKMLSSILPGYSGQLSPAQLMLKRRLVGPPLSPLEVVTRLLPQLAGGPGGAIQNLRVLRTFPGPEEYGYRQMLIRYQYTFVPSRDSAFASQAHPALRTHTQVPMQGAAYIVTFPYMPGQFSWTFGYRFLSAPYDVFQKNERIYAHIFEKFELIPEGLAQKVKTNEDMAKLADSMNKTTHDVAHDWWIQLGGLAEPAGGGYNESNRPARQQPACSNGQKSWFCTNPQYYGWRCFSLFDPPKQFMQCTQGERPPGTPR